MFTETIAVINHELEWINYELTRQSTNEKQTAYFEYRRQQLYEIKKACIEHMQVMDTLTPPPAGAKDV